MTHHTDTNIISSADVQAATDELFGRNPDVSTTTLPISCGQAFDLFADAARTAEWLPIIRRAHVLRRDEQERPTRVSYLANVDRGLLGYTLHYTYDTSARVVRFHTRADAGLRIEGTAHFTPLGDAACMMQYQLSVRVPVVESWTDPFFDSHPGSAVVHAFRDYAKRRMH